MPENSHGKIDLYCKIINAFVSLSTYYVIHLMDITSRHFAVAFNIPVHNISIYFEKLYSIRCFLVSIGYLVEYIFYQIGGGDRGWKNEGENIRKSLGSVCFGALFFARLVLLIVLYLSPQLSYHSYAILCSEVFFFSLHDASMMALAAKYASILSLQFHVARFTCLLVQFALDMFFYKNPLLMIKIQCFLCVLITGITAVLWPYYVFVLKPIGDLRNDSSESKDELTESEGGEGTKKTYGGDTSIELRGVSNEVRISDGLDSVIVPFIFLLEVSMCKDFLYPGTLPYALLPRDLCHSINMCFPILYTLGPLSLFVLDNVMDRFKKWEWYYNWFLFLGVNFPIIVVYSLMAIHSKVPSAIAIRNSRFRVMTMTLVMTFCLGFLEPLGYVAIGKYAFRGNRYGYTIQAIFNVYVLLLRSFFSRLSASYTVIRVSLGYHLPNFRPNHRMSKKNLGWYIFRHVFRKSWIDMKNDLKMDIKKYL